MQSIVITSGCSGCGTGSITAALGLQMARQGKKVLLAEAAPGLRRMNRLLAVREDGLFDLGDLLEGRCTLADAVLPTGTAGHGDHCAAGQEIDRRNRHHAGGIQYRLDNNAAAHAADRAKDAGSESHCATDQVYHMFSSPYYNLRQIKTGKGSLR